MKRWKLVLLATILFGSVLLLEMPLRGHTASSQAIPVITYHQIQSCANGLCRPLRSRLYQFRERRGSPEYSYNVRQYRFSGFVKVLESLPPTPEGNEQGTECTGVCVWKQDGKAYVLTAAHTPGHEPYIVRLTDGRKVPARKVDTSEIADLSLFEIEDQPGLEAIRTSETPVKKGDWLTFGGYGPGHGFELWRVCRGRVDQLISRSGADEYTQPQIGGGSRPGDSGGPVWNDDGHLVGIITATAEGEWTTCCYLPRMRAFLKRALPPYPRVRAVIKVPPRPRRRLVPVIPPAQETKPTQPAETTQYDDSTLRNECASIRNLVMVLEADVRKLKAELAEVRQRAEAPLLIKKRNTLTGEESLEELYTWKNDVFYFPHTPHSN